MAIPPPTEEPLDTRTAKAFRERFTTLFESGKLGLNEKGRPTDEAVGKALGLDQSQVWRLRTGDRVPTLAHALRVADFAGVSLDWLLGLPHGKGRVVIETDAVNAADAQDFIEKLRAAQDAGEKLFARYVAKKGRARGGPKSGGDR